MKQSILKSIRAADAKRKSWKQDVYAYLAVYRNTPHQSTNETPSELLFGRQLRTYLAAFKIESETEPTGEEVTADDQRAKHKMKMYTDKYNH